MRRSLSPWVVLLCGACSSPGARLALPPDADADAVIWAALTDEGPRLFAVDPRAPFDPDDFVASVDPSAVTELVALTYPEPLSRLGLDPGAVTLDAAGQPLPELHGTRRWRRTTGPQGRTPWVEVESLPDPLAAVRVARRSPCGVFTVESALPLPNDLTVTQAILQFDGAPPVLAVGSGYRSPVQLFSLARDVLEPLSTRLPYAEIHAWDDARRGAPWVAGTSSAGLELVELDAEARAVARLPPPPTAPGALAVVDDAAFILRGGALERWDGAAWRAELTSAKPFVEGTNTIALGVSRDEVMFLLPHGPVVGRWVRGDGARTFPFEPTSDIARAEELVRTLLAHPVLGPIISTSKGVVHRLERWPPRAEERWVPLATIPTGRSAGVMVAFDGGLLAAGIDGFLVEIHDGFGACPLQSVPGLNVYQLVQLPDGRWLASGTANGARGTRAVLLRWERP